MAGDRRTPGRSHWRRAAPLAPPATPPLGPRVLYIVMDWASEGRKSLLDPTSGHRHLSRLPSSVTSHFSSCNVSRQLVHGFGWSLALAFGEGVGVRLGCHLAHLSHGSGQHPRQRACGSSDVYVSWCSYLVSPSFPFLRRRGAFRLHALPEGWRFCGRILESGVCSCHRWAVMFSSGTWPCPSGSFLPRPWSTWTVVLAYFGVRKRPRPSRTEGGWQWRGPPPAVRRTTDTVPYSLYSAFHRSSWPQPMGSRREAAPCEVTRGERGMIF